MYSKVERDSQMMELVLSAKARSRTKYLANFSFTPPSMAILASDCVKLFDAAKHPVLRNYKKGEVTVYLRDVNISTVNGCDYLFLLLAISDKRRPDEVLSDPAADARRLIAKTGNEGSEYSCHIAIRTTPNKKGGNHYRAAFESVPSFGVYFVSSFLHHLFKLVSVAHGYSRPDPSGAMTANAKQMVNIAVAVALNAVPSEELLRDLRFGHMGEIELSREEEGVTGFDQSQFTKRKKSTLVLVPTSVGLSNKVMDLVNAVCQTGGKKDFSIAKFSFTGSTGQQASVKFDCNTSSVLTDRYIKRKTFVFANPLPSSCDVLHQEFCNELAMWAV